MIVEMTSCAPVVAFRPPAMAAHNPPAVTAARSASGRWMAAGKPRSSAPTMPAANPPITNCPSTPLLPEIQITTAPMSSATATAAIEPSVRSTTPGTAALDGGDVLAVIAGLLIARAPSHVEPELGAADLAVLELAGDAALIEHQDTVAEVQNLVQLEGEQQDPLAGVAGGDELLVDELDGADVEAARRLDGEQDVRITVQLAGDDQLLLVAAGEGAGDGVGRRGADVELLHQLARHAAAGAAVDAAAADERFALGVAE